VGVFLRRALHRVEESFAEQLPAVTSATDARMLVLRSRRQRLVQTLTFD
jgi:hypothetical protein